MPIQSQQINSKKEYYALARRHQLGNTIRQWTWREFVEMLDRGETETFPKRVALRGMTPASKAIQKYDLTLKMAYRRGLTIKVPQDEILVDEQAPDHLSTLRGEVMRDERYWYLRYDMTPGARMRTVMDTEDFTFPVFPARVRGMAHEYGLKAQSLLKQYMDENSWIMLMDLFDRYPEAIIEFSCYSKRLGYFNLNTIFWECRTGY
jgi:hypothetical protein